MGLDPDLVLGDCFAFLFLFPSPSDGVEEMMRGKNMAESGKMKKMMIVCPS